MNHHNQVLSRVQEWVTTTFPLARERQLRVEDSLLESGIIDSLGTLEVVEFLEREFGIRVEDEEMLADHFETILAISRFVASKQLDLQGDTAHL